MHRSSLTINRLNNQYLIDRSGANAGNDKRRFDRMATDSLGQTLGQSLLALLGDQPGLVLLDRLECDLAIETGLPNQTVIDLWASEVARVISRRLHDDTDQAMARFADADALLSAFLIDLVTGCAWQSWVYRLFDGLRALPLAAALRTALLDDPQRGLRVLLAMNDQQREMLIEVLSERECERVSLALAACAEVAQVAPGIMVDQILDEIRHWSPRYEGKAHNVLWYFLSANSRVDRHNAMQLRLIHELVELKISLSGGRVRDGFSAGQRMDGCALIENWPDAARTLVRLPVEMRQRVIEQLGRDSELASGASHRLERSSEGNWISPHGGVVLLIRFIAELPLGELPGSDPRHTGWLRLMILAKAMGHPRCPDVFNNQLLRELLGLAAGPTFVEVRDWLLDQPEENLWQWMSRVGDWRRAQWHGEAEDQVLANRYGLQHLVSESVKGAWLYGIHVNQPAQLRQRTASMVASRTPHQAGVLSRSLADFKFLRWSLLAREDESLDLTLSVLAQGIMRDLAFCLPGFANSSLEFLYRNFLDFSVRMDRVDQAAYQVHLARPTLNVIMNMTSLQRGAIALPWQPGVEMQLFPDSR